MSPLERFVDDRLLHGQATFSRGQAEADVPLRPQGLTAALIRLAARHRLASPHKGFFLILRPEDRESGAPDPAQWIDPLMNFLGMSYRVSLLRAAAFHGASHQAAMVFQVIVPKQLRNIEIGRHRLQFIYQSPKGFDAVNRSANLDRIKTDAGFAKVAGVELTLLDCTRYAVKASGIAGVAQVVQDIGSKADPGKLAQLADHYESACVRRLGHLLERAGHVLAADALAPVAAKAKNAVLLDPSTKPLIAALAEPHPRSARWKLILNAEVEVDF